MIKLKNWLLLILFILSSNAFSAKTFITTSSVDVYLGPNGVLYEQWPDRTLFTSNQQTTDWIEITGHFPEGEWQPLDPHLFIAVNAPIEERKVVNRYAPAMVIHKALTSRNTSARAYKLLQSAARFDSKEAALAYALKHSPVRMTLSQDQDIDLEDNESIKTDIVEQLPAGTVITTNIEDQYTLKVTGHFPDGAWQPLGEELWLAKPVKLQNRTQPKMYERATGTLRFAVIDKTRFNVTIYEVVDGQAIKLVTAPVALGYDRCLSAAKGGKCYYTPEGLFEIEFKLFDPDGINWCIPKKMEGEFKQKIAKGERCWRGIMGNHAMHFGDSLFLHGTSNPRSLGSRTTHGCVRLRNADIEVVFRLLADGDRVLISEKPEEFDLVAIAAQVELEKQRKMIDPSLEAFNAVFPDATEIINDDANFKAPMSNNEADVTEDKSQKTLDIGSDNMEQVNPVQSQVNDTIAKKDELNKGETTSPTTLLKQVDDLDPQTPEPKSNAVPSTDADDS